MSEALKDMVRLAPRFRRSANLEADFGTADALDGYVVSPLALEASARILGGLSASDGNRAWSIVGPYGSGKSSFLVFLGSLVTAGPTGDRARTLLRESADASGLAGDDSRTKRHSTLLPVLVTGEHVDLRVAILKGLHEAAARFCSGTGPVAPIVRTVFDVLQRARSGSHVSDSDVVACTAQLAEHVKDSKKPGQGLLILVDELGKLVEWAALRQATSDIYLLQQLAEAAARTRGARISVVTTLHQGLDAYAESLPRVVRREWAKVGGRFEVIPYLESPRHVVRLVAGAVRPSPELLSSRVGRVIKEDAEKLGQLLSATSTGLPQHAGSQGDFPSEALSSCAPLHPLVVLALGPLFRARLGQNERSLFAFLSSHEPFGFQSYLGSNTLGPQTEPYRLDNLYDYVLANTGARVVGADSDRTWTATEQALSRLPPSATSVDARALKCIALLSLAAGSTGMRPDESTLSFALGCRPRVIADCLGRLLASSCVVFRKFKSSYQIWDGSDLDVGALVSQGRAMVTAQGRLAERLERLFPLFPIVATRHYHRTGTLRHLVPRFIGVPTNLDQVPVGDSGDGDLLMVVPERADELRAFRAMIDLQRTMYSSADDGGGRPRIVALPRHAEQLLDAALDYFAVDEVLKTTPELASDPVARRELEERKLKSQDRVADAIAASYTSSHDNLPLQWFYRGELIASASRPSFLASLVCDKAYEAAPVILNELINRDELSSAASSARRVLMERLFTHRHQPRLGIDGFPPELGIYRSLFEKTGLHAGGDRGWDIAEPTPGSVFSTTWQALDRALERAGGGRMTFAALQDVLRAPPLGLRDGVAALLLLVYYLTRRQQLFLYEDNSFVPLASDDMVQRLLKKPATFELQRSLAEAGAEGIVYATGRALELGDPVSLTLLDVVKHIIAIVLKLSPYASTTQELSESARRIRSVVKSARDPVKLLLVTLPEALGLARNGNDTAKAGNNTQTFASKVRLALDELRGLDGRLIARIDQTLRRFLGGDRTDSNFYANLIPRAGSLRGKPFLPLVARNFVDVTASANVADNDYFRSVGTAIVGKPVSHWTDADAQHFDYRALDVARAFTAAEEMMLARGERAADVGVPMVRVSVVDSSGRERHGVTTWTSKTRLDTFMSAVQGLAQQHAVSSEDLAYAVIASMMNNVAPAATNEDERAA